MKRANSKRMAKYSHKPTAYPAPRPYVEDEVYRTFAMEAFHSRLYKEWRDWFEKEMQIKHGDRTGVIDLTFSSGQHYDTVHAKLTWRPLYPTFDFKFPKIELKNVDFDFTRVFPGVKFDREDVLRTIAEADAPLTSRRFKDKRVPPFPSDDQYTRKMFFGDGPPFSDGSTG